ncbi:MAG: TlpA disulfide reductase family protein [Beijerinckiaceae bacterium]|nr:TlpA disulfide reductase family protein [Beijerinckiaceae bacterium]
MAGALALVAASGIGLYALMPHGGKATAHSGACARSLDLAQALDPLARGDVAALILASAPNDLGAIAFDDGDGGHKIVADFKGRSILLNLWATWCVPCRAEMPALDRLEGALGSKTFQVVPVDIDTARLDRPRAFLQEIGARHVKFFSDHSADILQTLHGTGLPTSVLIGPDGCEIGTMAGPALWDSPDAKALIERIAAPSNGA